MSHNHPTVEQALKLAGLKATAPRRDIMSAFSHECEPMSAEQVHRRIEGSSTNLVTVYRTLASLESAGILKRVDLRKGAAHYELAGHHHHHVVCTDCGRTEGFEMCGINAVSRKVLRRLPAFKAIHQHSLELYGTCKACAETR